jgi:hypothetical protein
VRERAEGDYLLGNEKKSVRIDEHKSTELPVGAEVVHAVYGSSAPPKRSRPNRPSI